MNLDESVNSEVDLFGLAENAMSGAVVLCGPGAHVYIDGLREWPDEHLYQAVRVSGTLVEEGEDVDSTSPEAVHALGRHFVIKDPSWEWVR